MQRTILPQRYFSVPDLLVVLMIGTVIYGLVVTGETWRAEYHPVSEISLSLTALPRYAFLSAIRGIIAYCFSLAFTLVVGYTAAKSRRAEKFLIPMLDILQSIPVLGFLPGLVLGLVALFPRTNMGLELAAIMMIFAGQVWNMTFSLYNSLKSVPADLTEASRMMGLNWWQRFLRLELPFSAIDLSWNSLLAMAGGWFYLTICEAFTLGDYQFRLPGVGAYMAVAIDQGNVKAEIAGVCAMIAIIVLIDSFIWRPIFVWVQRFRSETAASMGVSESPTQSLMKLVLRESLILRWLLPWVTFDFRRRVKRAIARIVSWIPVPRVGRAAPADPGLRSKMIRYVEPAVWGLMIALIAIGSIRLLRVLLEVPPQLWLVLLRDALCTFGRVVAALALSTMWAVPAGIWIGTSKDRIRVAQPLIQVLASFPAPMLYPLILAVLFALRINFQWASMFLIFVGVQWYVLFNVIAGALRVPQELADALSMMNSSRWDRWMKLYIPSVFPTLVTGWVTAAGGAWNASIVAEYIQYNGKLLTANGLGAAISSAAASKDFKLLAASLTIMVAIVILLNRSVWARLYQFAQTRFRMA